MAENEYYRLDLVVGVDDSRLRQKTKSSERVFEKFQRKMERRTKMIDRLNASPAVRLKDRISSPLRRVERRLSNLSRKAISVTITAKDMVSNILKRIKRGLTSLPGVLGLGIATLGPPALAAGIGKKALKTFGDFQQAMANVASVSGATDSELKMLTQTALQMGKTTQFKASQAADALYYLSSAGFTVNEQISALKGTLDLAAATQADLAFTSETVASSLSSFGLDASQTDRVVNVYAATISNSQATIQKLADSLRYVGPVASSFGMSIEESTAALGGLYNAGLKGEQAGTTLRAALAQLANPAGQAKEAIRKLGLSSDDLNPALHSLTEIISALESRSIDTGVAMQLFGTEAAPGMVALIRQGSTALEDMETKITGTNKATEMASRQMDTLFGSVKYLQSAWEVFLITIGGEKGLGPAARNFVEKLTKQIGRLEKVIMNNLDSIREF